MRRLIIPLLLFAFFASACAQNPPAAAPIRPDGLQEINLPMGYIPNVQYAPFYVAAEKGYYADAGFSVNFDYAFETDGVALVGDAKRPFAIASGEQVLLARDQGLPVVYVMAWYKDYPISIVAKKEAGLRTPADLQGKRIGLPGLFGANYVGLKALLYATNIDATNIRLKAIGFNQVEALAANQVDAVVVYTTNEPVQLRAQGYELAEIKVADYVQLVSNGIITNETLLQENPEMVRRFIQATIRGLQDTVANPDEAYEISKKYVPNLAQADSTLQKQVLQISIDLWQIDPPGFSDPRAWANMEATLLQMGQIGSPMQLENAFSNDYLP